MSSSGAVIPRSARSRRRHRSWYASRALRSRPRAFPPAATLPHPRSPFASHGLLLLHALLLRQTASTHLREGLLTLCPGEGDATTLRDIIEACDAEHRRLGGDLANATDEDVRLFALFSTAAKCFLCAPSSGAGKRGRRAREPGRAPRLASSARGERVGYRYRRSTASIDRERHATQVIDECVAAVRRLNEARGTSRAARRRRSRAFRRDVFENVFENVRGAPSDGDVDDPSSE